MSEVVNLGDIETMIRPSAKGSSAKSGAVILFHGYGADMRDLYPLADLIDPRGELTWYFPNGVLDVVIAPGFRGRAWYQINMNKLQELMRSGKTADMSETRPQGMDAALSSTQELVEEVMKKHSNVVIGGFSQGAILSTELVCQMTTAPKGVVLMSAGFVDSGNLSKILKTRSGLPYIQSHGTQDAILGHDGAKKLNALLNQSGWRGDFVSFTGGHEIPEQVLSKVGAFIMRQFR